MQRGHHFGRPSRAQEDGVTAGQTLAAGPCWVWLPG
eukprot:COSAG01_NODE_654_length_14482_cov_20.826347_1_plen_35_part_10